MGPKGKSKALALKHSYLGQFMKNARRLDERKILIADQEKILEESTKMKEQLTIDVQNKQREIKNVSRKLAHKISTFNDLTSKVKNVNSSLTKLETSSCSENSFTISKRKKQQRKKKPTNRLLSHTSKVVRRSETFQACSEIHGASIENVEPLVHGMIDTLTSKVKAKDLSKSVLAAKSSFVNEIKENVITQWNSDLLQIKRQSVKIT